MRSAMVHDREKRSGGFCQLRNSLSLWARVVVRSEVRTTIARTRRSSRSPLVPHPRAHQLTYHGVLAPASAWRDLVVSKRAPHIRFTFRVAACSRPIKLAQRFRALVLVVLDFDRAPALCLRRRRITCA